MLRHGYSGHIRDAQCSIKRDAEQIMHEISTLSSEEKVDEAIDTLLTAGLYSPDLVRATALAGELENVARWRPTALVSFGICALHIPVFLLFWDTDLPMMIS